MESGSVNKVKKAAGGKRAGAGRKLKYGEKTKTMSFRVPVGKKSEIKLLVKDKLTEYSVAAKLDLLGAK